MTIHQIITVKTIHYSDNDQTTTYVEWLDTRGKWGRTEFTEGRPGRQHMLALLARAKREGVEHLRETW